MDSEDTYKELTKQHDGYAAGICNISGPEVSRRALTAWMHCAMVILFTFLVYVSGASHFWRFVVGVPAFFASLGFLQAGNRFCVAFGMMGYENATGILKGEQKVWSAAARKADRWRSIRLMVAAFLIALTVATTIFMMPTPKPAAEASPAVISPGAAR